MSAGPKEFQRALTRLADERTTTLASAIASHPALLNDVTAEQFWLDYVDNHHGKPLVALGRLLALVDALVQAHK